MIIRIYKRHKKNKTDDIEDLDLISNKPDHQMDQIVKIIPDKPYDQRTNPLFQ